MKRHIQKMLWISIGALTLTATSTFARADEVRYDDHHLVTVRINNEADLKRVRDLGGMLMSCHEHIGTTDYLFAPEEMDALRASGLTFVVRDANVQKAIDAERERLRTRAVKDARGADWYDDFRTFSEIEARLDAWATDYPGLVQLVDIGDSIEGRDLWALRIGNAPDKPAVLFNGTQHAREWISPMTNMYIAEHMITNYGVDPAITDLVDRIEFIIVPVVNPDGYVFSHESDRLWRKNRRFNGSAGCYGVDPNRNWGVGWSGSGASSYPCDLTYFGTSAFSEPETAALRDFFLANPQIVSNIDYHSYSQLILSPYGYTTSLPAENDTYLALGAAMANEIYNVHGENYVYGPIADTLYVASGGSVDWVYDVAGAYSFTVELRPNSFFPGFELPPDEIIPTVEENLPAALLLAEWSASPVRFLYPDGQPASMVAGETGPLLRVLITSNDDITLEPDSVKLKYRTVPGRGFGELIMTPSPMSPDEYTVNLPAPLLGERVEYFVEVEDDGGQLHTSPNDAPNSLFTLDVVEAAYYWNLDTDPGWTMMGQWAWGQPTGNGGVSYGQPDPDSGHTGANVLGYNLNGDYGISLAEQHLTSTPIDCSNLTNVQLRFWRWLNVETSAYDHAYVRVSNDGTNWVTVWENGGEITDTSWSEQVFDISAVADGQATVYLRWTMGTTDFSWQYSGWNIDDIALLATVESEPCPWDVTGDFVAAPDGFVNTWDFFDLLQNWGICGFVGCPYDFDLDGFVDVDDFFELLQHWGPCP